MEYHAALLSQINSISSKSAPCTPLSDYNIFRILEVSAKEVIMCRFLADLLNPQGQHGYGILFLKSFMQDIIKEYSMSDLLLAHTDVFTEYAIDNERRIDIVIQNSRFFIPIEVKIYAGEQERQCYDYYKYARNARIVYLTRFGDAPSSYSRKKKGGTDILSPDNIQCISWIYDICKWLKKLARLLEDPVKSMVMQYIDAVYMTADEGDKKRMEKNLELLYKSPDYFHAGLEIEKSMKTAKVNLMQLMFDDFKKEMEAVAPKYGLEPEKKFNYYTCQENSKKFYDKNASTYPGLNYIVKKASFHPENIQMWFRIEVEYHLFAGIALFDTKAESEDGISTGCEIDEITEQLLEQAAKYINRDIICPAGWWVTWCYPNGKRLEDDNVPDFKNMNPCAIRLVDKQTRKNFVKNAVKIFEEHILKYLHNTFIL